MQGWHIWRLTNEQPENNREYPLSLLALKPQNPGDCVRVANLKKPSSTICTYHPLLLCLYTRVVPRGLHLIRTWSWAVKQHGEMIVWEKILQKRQAIVVSDVWYLRCAAWSSVTKTFSDSADNNDYFYNEPTSVCVEGRSISLFQCKGKDISLYDIIIIIIIVKIYIAPNTQPQGYHWSLWMFKSVYC